jgi:hypothetical protein
VQQRQRIRITDMDFTKHFGGGGGAGGDKSKHGTLLPDSIRCIICGPSNCGKTNVMFNLLFDVNGLRFSNVYVFSKSLFQPKYRMLETIMKSLSEEGIGFHAYSENDEIPPPNEVAANSIMVFDDVSCERQHNIRKYFAMGRHSGVDAFYLCQTYSQAPKQLVRDNANLIVLFRQDDLNLQHAYKDHVNTDMKYEHFKDVCAAAWKDRYGFLVVDKDSPINTGRYRVGFDRFIIPNGV